MYNHKNRKRINNGGYLYMIRNLFLILLLICSTAYAGNVTFKQGAGGGNVNIIGTAQSMTYPSAGIATSTGSAWGTSITDNHNNWDDGYTYRLLSASGTSPLNLSLVANALSGSIDKADTTHDGYISSDDWNTFNGKQAAGSYLTSVYADSPLGGNGTSGSHLTVDLSSKQGLSSNLTSLSGLTYATPAFVRMTGANTFTLDTTLYQPAGNYLTTGLTSAYILVGNSSNIATAVAMSGDATISNTGVVSVSKTRITARNETGSAIATTKAVYVSGFNNYPLIALADNTNEDKHNVVGITVGSINDQSNGEVLTGGIADAETNSWVVGTELYLSTAGALTATKPTSGAVKHVGIVTVQQNYPSGKLLLYGLPELNTLADGSGEDIILRTGDSIGANVFSFRKYDNTPIVTIKSNGYVGVGSTNPAQAVDVVGNGTFTGTLTASNLSGTNTGNQDLSPYQLLSEKNASNGYAGLDVDSKIYLGELAYHNHQAGIEGAPTITEGTSGNAGKLSVDVGEAWFYTDTTQDEMALHTIAASGWLAPSDDTTTYVCADRNTDSWVLLTAISSIDYIRYVPYFIVFKRSGSNSLHHQVIELTAHGEVENHHKRVLSTNKYDREAGALESISVDSNLYLAGSGGGVWAVNHRYQILDISASSRQFKGVNTNGTWAFTSALVPVINNTQWNDLSVGLDTLTDTYWTTNYIFRGIEDQDHVYTILGTQEYATSALAQADNTIPTLPDLITSHTMFMGRVIVQKSATSNYIIESAFKNIFAASTAVTSHASLSGLTAANVHPASSITNTPAGNIASTDVQNALNELDTEKQILSNNLTSLTGLTYSSPANVRMTGTNTFALDTTVYQPAGAYLTTLTTATPTNLTGFIKGNGSVLSADNSTYLTGNQSITLGGILSGSGTTSISASAASGYYMPATADQTNWNGKLSAVSVSSGLTGNGTGATPLSIDSSIYARRGTLTNTKWCTTDGTSIACTSDTPGGGLSGLTPGMMPKAATSTTIVDSGVYNTDSMIGIGTTVPTHTIELVTAAVDSQVYFKDGTVSAYTGIDHAGLALDLATKTAHPVRIETNDTVRVLVDANGNVGIGTSTPKNDLDISSGITVGSGWAGVYIAPTNGIISQGCVGIGTTAPVNSLEVGSTSQFKVASTGAITGVGITNSGAYTQSGTNINYFSGNVGIGSTAPPYTLEVVSGRLALTNANLKTVRGAGNAVTVGTCGTSPTVGTNSNNMAGYVNTGSGTVTACTIVWGASPAWTTAPFCTITPYGTVNTTARMTALTTTLMTVGLGTSMPSSRIYYHCIDN